MQRFIIFLLLVTLALAGCGPATRATSQPGETVTQVLAPTAESGEATATSAPVATEVPAASQPLTQTEQPGQPSETAGPQETQAWIAYTSTDGNIWMLDTASGEDQ
ncbi:MAG TPA: hypothetical protein VE131_10965, partial [Terriglobales bacterium]|nr:hypothetical protein [Terriglobales bacterium]